MKILIELTYYRPHTSGLTIYAERLAKAFVQKGHQVTVLTSQYNKSLPREELLDGVRFISGGAETNSIIMRSRTHTLRYIKAIHQFDYKPLY